MSEPEQSPPLRDARTVDARMSEVQAQDENKPRLTEAQKRQNHISSEQKRRQAIRDGFDKLSNMVPGLEGMGRSEGLVLNRTVEHILQQIQERKDLIAQIEAKGIVVDDVYKRVTRIDLSQINVENLDPSAIRPHSPSSKTNGTNGGAT